MRTAGAVLLLLSAIGFAIFALVTALFLPHVHGSEWGGTLLMVVVCSGLAAACGYGARKLWRSRGG